MRPWFSKNFRGAASSNSVPRVPSADFTMQDMRTTMMFVLYAYFYSMVEDDPQGVNGFRVWRAAWPEEENAIAAVEALVTPLVPGLKLFRNRLGFHGSRSRSHEAKAFDLFSQHSGTAVWNAMANFKSLAARGVSPDA